MTRGSPEASPISFGGPLPCGICAREVPREPVVLATCGHLYCWPCLYRSDPSQTEIASAARALAAPPAAASSRSSFGALPTRRHPPRVESSKTPPGTSSLAPSPESSNRADARLGSVPPPPRPLPRARVSSQVYRSARRAPVPGVRRPVHAREHLADLHAGRERGRRVRGGRGRRARRYPAASDGAGERLLSAEEGLSGATRYERRRRGPRGGVREDRAGGGGDARRDRGDGVRDVIDAEMRT